MAAPTSNWASLVPGSNPTGYNGPIYDRGYNPGSSSGANPYIPPTNIPPTAPTTNNPYGGGVPFFGANSGGYSPTSLLPSGPAVPGAAQGGTTVGAAGSSPIGGFNLMTPTDLSRMFDSLKKTYGDGTAHAIMDFLSSGAGFNQSAINNLFAALQPGIERGTESLMEQFSTSGNRFGSAAQIGMADYLSQVQLNEGQLETQMYEQSINDFMSVLMGTGKDNASRIMSSPSTLSTIGSALPIIGAGAGAASAAGVGGTAGTILDVIAAMGAGACWVASELYGGWFAPETVSIRKWLMKTWYMQPFLWFYKKYGVRWANLIRRNQTARFLTKKLFDRFLEASR